MLGHQRTVRKCFLGLLRGFVVVFGSDFKAALDLNVLDILADLSWEIEMLSTPYWDLPGGKGPQEPAELCSQR